MDAGRVFSVRMDDGDSHSNGQIDSYITSLLK